MTKCKRRWHFLIHHGPKISFSFLAPRCVVLQGMGRILLMVSCVRVGGKCWWSTTRAYSLRQNNQRSLYRSRNIIPVCSAGFESKHYIIHVTVSFQFPLNLFIASSVLCQRKESTWWVFLCGYSKFCFPCGYSIDSNNRSICNRLHAFGHNCLFCFCNESNTNGNPTAILLISDLLRHCWNQ